MRDAHDFMWATMWATASLQRRTVADARGPASGRNRQRHRELRTPAGSGGKWRKAPGLHHNPRVTGSNPVAATTPWAPETLSGAFFWTYVTRY